MYAHSNMKVYNKAIVSKTVALMQEWAYPSIVHIINHRHRVFQGWLLTDKC